VEIWKKMVQEYPLDQESIEPVIFLQANDNWLEYTLRYIVDYRKQRATKNQLFETFVEEIMQSDGKVAISSTTLPIVDFPAIKLDNFEKRAAS
jgi:hypothetical protein